MYILSSRNTIQSSSISNIVQTFNIRDLVPLESLFYELQCRIKNHIKCRKFDIEKHVIIIINLIRNLHTQTLVTINLS